MMTTTTTEGVRLRVAFKERHILSKSQRTQGLRRSWILLKPHHRTISDLAAYLLHAFDLHSSCPDGLLISMDGFVLPPFESTSIFKDKDIISVKRKEGTLSEIALLDDGTDAIEVEEIVERQPMNTRMNLLANEGFEKETGGYDSDSEEDGPDHLEDLFPVENPPDNGSNGRSKKRKRSDKPQSSKRKRIKSSATEECSGLPEGLQNDVCAEKKKSSHQSCVLTRKRHSKMDKSFTVEDGLDNSSTRKTDERIDGISKSVPNGKRSCQLQENKKKGVVSSETPGESKKLPSRSARRKKAKRQWLREKMKAEKEELHQTQLLKTNNQQSTGKDNQKCPEEHQQPNTNNEEVEEQSDTDGGGEDEQMKIDNNEVVEQPYTDNDKEDDIVPVVIRPGHIRFEPLGKVDENQPIQQKRTPVEIFRWNGITSKKRGQKWGMEKTSHSRTSDYNDLNQESPAVPDIEKEIPVNDHIDFNKLELCTTLPKEGDQIAYRLIELTSCWTPEVSSYRVGEVSQYDPQSNKIMLVQVPEYPIVFAGTDEASDVVPDTSLYGQDRSLEVDYSSLFDVRIFKHGNLNTAKPVTGDQDVASGSRQLDKDMETHAATRENGRASAWDEINQAFNAKKAELSQEENGWSKNDGSVRSSWSYRGLRGSALGPVVARLRAQGQ
ncbi:coilin isoform X1 [Pyrus x bretschneideri]|uniref:coilin isoform X1 n=1 Tax=Pyrus x bretschneideri TaxID=225117 RepID=UPI00202E36D7|nr:coilin isoform X1 [Pyrus x bretschneideri]